jgi:molecular chaperone GrpE
MTDYPSETTPPQPLSEADSAEASAVLDDLQAQLDQARVEAADSRDQARRAAAELANARKRMAREQAEFNTVATARVMARLLPILDDIDRAVAALPADDSARDWANGFRLIQSKLRAMLTDEGVTPIVTEGQMFNPAFHEAVSYEEQPGLSEGQIIGEIARGYRIGDRVLKPSLVRVARPA